MTPDYIVCLEDGKKFKSLKRHLRTQYNMTPEQYREKWGLPADYPMVAPNYAEARSRLAKQMGLGQQRRRRASSIDSGKPKRRSEPRSCYVTKASSHSSDASASALRASALTRSTMERRPFERCGVRCSRRPMRSNNATASVAMMSRAVLPE